MDNNLIFLGYAITPRDANKYMTALSEGGIKAYLEKERVEFFDNVHNLQIGKILIYVDEVDIEQAQIIFAGQSENPHLESGEYIPETDSEARAYREEIQNSEAIRAIKNRIVVFVFVVMMGIMVYLMLNQIG